MVGCFDPAEDGRIRELESELAELRSQIATGADQDDQNSEALLSELRAAVLEDMLSRRPSPEPTATTELTSEPISPSVVRWVANTGGVGVSLRSACEIAARSGGSWSEATRVVVTARGTGPCDGWSFARVGGIESWVANGYLATSQPPLPPPPTAAPTTTPSPPTPTAAPVVTPTPTATPVATPTPAPAPTLTPWQIYAAQQCLYYQSEYLRYQQAGAAPTFLNFVMSKVQEWC